MRDIDEAKAILRGEGFHGPLVETGLRKICPRCGRGGWVFPWGDSSGLPDSVLVIWDGRARGVEPADIDNSYPEEILDPSFGCGYDDAEAIGLYEAKKFVRLVSPKGVRS